MYLRLNFTLLIDFRIVLCYNIHIIINPRERRSDVVGYTESSRTCR